MVAAGVGVTGAVAVLSLVVGFVLLPYAETNSRLTGLWDTICSAAGVPRATVVSEAPRSTIVTSNVVMNSQMFGPPDTPLRRQGRDAGDAMRDLPWIEPAGPGRYA